MEKLPKIALPFIILFVVIVVLISKSAITIGSGQAGVLYKTFDGGVVTDKPALGEGFHIVMPVIIRMKQRIIVTYLLVR